MTQENLNELKAAKATFEKYAADLDIQIQKLEAQINSEFIYPMWLRDTTCGEVYKFISLNVAYDRFGTEITFTIPHTDTSVWEQVPEPKQQWEPKGTFGFILEEFEYKPSYKAEWAREHMRRFNRLLAYVAEFDVDENGVQWQPSFDNNKFDCCYIAFDYQKQSWIYYSSKEVQVMSVYMSEKCAKELVKKLNSGEVVL